MQSQNKYFIYARAAVQNDTSINNQIEAMLHIAKIHNLEVIDFFTEGASAAKPDTRKAFNEMISLIKQGEANSILCADLSRLARNAVEQGLIQHLLITGVIKHIKTQHGDYYPHSNVITLTFEFGCIQEYSRRLSKSIKQGSQRRRSATKNQ